MPHVIGSVIALHRSGGGVPKDPVTEVEVSWSGVVGDVQADRRHHGRPFQALCLWSADVIDALVAEGHPVYPGAAGENITVEGVRVGHAAPGHHRAHRRGVGGDLVLRHAVREERGRGSPSVTSSAWTRTCIRVGAACTRGCSNRARSARATRSRSSRLGELRGRWWRGRSSCARTPRSGPSNRKNAAMRKRKPLPLGSMDSMRPTCVPVTHASAMTASSAWCSAMGSAR